MGVLSALKEKTGRLSIVTVAATQTGRSEPVGVQWQRWSTEMHLLVTEPAELCRARAIVDAELDEIELAASRFRRDSEVCALAEAEGARRPVSPVFADLIEAALAAASMTDGDVDPTVGNAVIALGYDAAFADTPVPRIASLAVPIDWTAIEFDGTGVRVPAGVVLDLGATAKAVAADRCAQRVLAGTGSGVLVNLGGDLATAGAPPVGGWRILVQDSDDDPPSEVVIGSGVGLATSSTQRRRWTRGDRSHHHIVDPRTGSSAEPVWRSVTVVGDSCLVANAVSTASIIRGQRALDWVASLGLAARFVDRDRRQRAVGGWPQ